MEIIRLTKDNAEKYGYGCMMKGNLFVLKPGPYREAMLPDLKHHIGRDLEMFTALDGQKPVGHLLAGSVKSLSLPMHVTPESPVIFCTYVSYGYGRKGIGKQLIDAAKKAFHDQPGLLVMSTKIRAHMPFTRFERLGFRMVHEHDLWRIGYLPIQKDDIRIDFYNAELEWDYMNPFTLVKGGFCPFMLHLWEGQKKAAQSFKKYAPVEVMTLEEAQKKDPNAIQGFYVFGKSTPAKPMFGWQFKRVVRKAIRDEETKTFGAASKTSYEKRKKKTR